MMLRSCILTHTHQSQPFFIDRQPLKRALPYRLPFPNQQRRPPKSQYREERRHPQTPSLSNLPHPRRHKKGQRQTKRQPIQSHYRRRLRRMSMKAFNNIVDRNWHNGICREPSQESGKCEDHVM